MENDGIVVDTTSDGDLDGLVKDLSAATTAQDSTQQDDGLTGDSQASGDNRPEWIDEKFWTGDVQESAQKQGEAYRNLQTSYGRMANDLGTQRKLTDQVLGMKREDDLSRNTPEPVRVDGADLLDKPNETLDEYLRPRLAETTEQLENRLSGIEATLAQQAFVTQHPDYNEIANDPKFADWVKESPIRARAAQQAIAGDYGLASELLAEYKQAKTAGKTADTTADERPSGDDLDGARKVALESNASSQSNSSGKVYNRADLIRLKLEKPHIYEEPKFQEEIMKAYAEGRVK